MVLEESIEQHANGSITGVVFWNMAGRSFPDGQWNDFVIVVLGWWNRAIAQMLAGASSHEVMDFMDGPYSVACECSGARVICRFLERAKKGQDHPFYAGKASELAAAIMEASEVAIRSCRRHGFSSPDVELLAKRVSTLRRILEEDNRGDCARPASSE